MYSIVHVHVHRLPEVIRLSTTTLPSRRRLALIELCYLLS